jgi:hypothetical protein
MTNKSMPMFMAAPRIELRLENTLIGFAIGFNFNISVEVQPVYMLGSVSPVSLEPTYYNVVTGTMQIVRLMSPENRADVVTAADTYMKETTDAAASESVNWNDISTGTATSTTGQATAPTNPIGKSNLLTHLDPRLVQISRLFDMSVYVRVPLATAETFRDADKGIVTATKTIDQTKVCNPVKWLEIRGCRLTGRSTNITLGQMVNEPINFNGLLAVAFAGDGTTEMIKQDNAYKDA